MPKCGGRTAGGCGAQVNLKRHHVESYVEKDDRTFRRNADGRLMKVYRHLDCAGYVCEDDHPYCKGNARR